MSALRPFFTLDQTCNQADPATLVIHGQDDKTWLSLGTPMETRSRQNLELAVRKILIHRHSHPSTSVEVMYEIRSAG